MASGTSAPVKFTGDNVFTTKIDGLPRVGDEVKLSRPIYKGPYPNQTFVEWEYVQGKVIRSSRSKTRRLSFTIATATGKAIVYAITMFKHGVWRKESDAAPALS